MKHPVYVHVLVSVYNACNVYSTVYIQYMYMYVRYTCTCMYGTHGKDANKEPQVVYFNRGHKGLIMLVEHNISLLITE